MSTSDAVTTQSPALSSEDRSARIAVTVFPLLILAAFAIAMITPDTFKPLAPGVNWALGVIMFGMGLTLTLPDFGLIVKRPLPVFVGVVAQYLIMPLVGWALCYVFRLPDAVAVGVILVGCAPGGTSSNVISYLAKADVALSVTMTSISTLLAPLMTPMLTAWLVGNRMPVDGAAMAKNILLMVLAPVLGGFIVRFVAGKFVEKILPLLPWISVFGICYVLLVVVSGSVNKILTSGALIIAVVICHNLLGYLFGTWPDALAAALTRRRARPRSRLACRTRRWPRRWRRPTSLPPRKPRSRQPCSPCGTTCPARCWRCSSVAGRTVDRPKWTRPGRGEHWSPRPVLN